MKYTIGYSFVKPENTGSQEANNIHIFRGLYDPQSNRSMLLPSRRSCCRQSGPAIFDDSDLRAVGNTDEDARAKARLMAAKLQNRGEEVCGQCVATFYKDGV